MELDNELHGDCLLVRIRGELDHHWSGRLRQSVDRALEERSANNLVLNLEGLSFMDSSGVGVLLGRYRRIAERHGRMAVCGVPPAVEKVLQISGVPRVIPFYKNEAEALRQISGKQPPGRRSK